MGWTIKKYAVLMSGAVALVVIAWVGLLNYESFSQGFKNGGSSDGVPASGSQDAPAPSPQTAEAPEVMPLGTPADVVGHHYQVKVERSQVVNSLNPGDTLSSPVEAGGGKLVVVYLTFMNTGPSASTLPQTRFRLRDSQGRQYDEVYEGRVSVLKWLATQGLDSPVQRVLPGHSAKTAQVFRVAADASNLKLVVNESPGSDDTLLAIQ